MSRLLLVWLARRLHYVSTYCLHGKHQECRIVCKHCEKTCRCGCHR